MAPWRFLLPNLVTSLSIAFAILGVQEALAGHPRSAAWWLLYCVLTDKLDGALARRVRGSSGFGLQLDSLADFLSFGVAPATVIYAFFSRHPEAGWSSPTLAFALRVIGVLYVVCAGVRLARFNVITAVQESDRFFFGMPTTFSGGMVCALFLTALKYGDPAWSAGDPAGMDLRLLGALRLDRLMSALPLVLLGGGLLMVSTLRVPKLAKTPHLALNAWFLANVVMAYTIGWARVIPEYLAFGAITYLAGTLWYHFTSPVARTARLPPVFGAQTSHLDGE